MCGTKAFQYIVKAIVEHESLYIDDTNDLLSSNEKVQVMNAWKSSKRYNASSSLDSYVSASLSMQNLSERPQSAASQKRLALTIPAEKQGLSAAGSNGNTPASASIKTPSVGAPSQDAPSASQQSVKAMPFSEFLKRQLSSSVPHSGGLSYYSSSLSSNASSSFAVTPSQQSIAKQDVHEEPNSQDNPIVL